MNFTKFKLLNLNYFFFFIKNNWILLSQFHFHHILPILFIRFGRTFIYSYPLFSRRRTVAEYCRIRAFDGEEHNNTHRCSAFAIFNEAYMTGERSFPLPRRSDEHADLDSRAERSTRRATA